MRSDLTEIEHDACSVHGIGIRLRRIGHPALDVVVGKALDALRCQAIPDLEKIFDRDRIYWEPANQRPPLCRHVGDGKPCIHRKTRHAYSAELDGCVQYFIVVVEPAKGNDDVFSRGSRGQCAFQYYLHRPWNLPPELSSRPDCGCISAYDRSSHRAQSAIHVGMRV